MSPESCLVCGHEGLDPHFDVLLRCPSCRFVTARLDPGFDPARVYATSYFTGSEYFDYRSDEAFFSRTFRRRLDELVRRRASGRLLEIGAAYGFFLGFAREHFQVVGYELNGEAARYARELFAIDVRSDDFLEATPDSIGGPVDVTVMWDVIEHLARPDLYLSQVASLSRAGSLLYITTGDIGSILARLRGRRWRMIHPPSHLHYFSRATLGRLLAKCGFRVIEVRSVGVARSLRQILYSVLVLRLGQLRVFELCQRFVPQSWGFTLNTFDIMQVIAERS
jgi:cyclopropane fatty-acyl-phospholipid synthase-like methyltransferase